MALGAAAHHSAQRCAALRGPKRGTRAREGEVPEKYDAPRRQNAPHPGERPGILAEPGPQRSDRSLWRSAEDSLPHLVTPSLMGAAGEGVDSGTRLPPLSVAGEEGSLRLAAAAQAGQGRVCGLAGQPQPLSSPGGCVAGAC